jgi:hypothetical protein
MHLNNADDTRKIAKATTTAAYDGNQSKKSRIFFSPNLKSVLDLFD